MGGGEEYRKRKKEYKRLCRRKREEENEEWTRRAREARTEGQVWEVVRKERRKGKGGMGEGIEMEEWNRYFRDLLGGVESRVVMGGNRREKGKEEDRIERGEIRRAIERIKERKAVGVDGIPGEVWKYGGEGIEEWVWEICNKIWKGEGWIREWSEGLVVPILKRGEGREVSEYRGVTLAPSLYKVYATVLAERLKGEVEEGGMLPNQTGFRKGMGTVDNIYVLNYLINRQICRRGRQMVLFFVDLRAAFDSVDRVKLIAALRGRGVKEGTVKRCEEVLGEIGFRVRIGEEVGEKFWTGRGVRQGCPLSPLLFNMLMADMEEEMRKGRWGGVRLGEGRVYTLAYADDVVLMAEDEGGMRCMMERLGRYLEEKGLELNESKSKVMRCRKGGGRLKKASWFWKGKKIEEVKEYKYLGYIIQRNGKQDGQVRDRIKRGAAVMGQVWGIGKRRFGSNWGRRIWLFDALVWTVLGYGVEIWGWEEREGLERIQERYLRWILGVDWGTPGYMVREELQREKLRTRMGRRAWGYEKRLEEGKGGGLAKVCLGEIKERAKKGGELSDWERERREYFEGKGMKLREIEERREKGEFRWEEIEDWEKKKQRDERREKIERSEYNKWYKQVKGEGIPGYLKKGWTEVRWRRIAKYRLGNGMRGNRYWEKEEERKCRMCGRGTETWEHVWEDCMGREESWQEMVMEVLGEEGEGEGWLKMLVVARGEGEGEDGKDGKGGQGEEGG